MSNIAQVLKAEILRLAGKVTREQVGKLKRDVLKLRKSNVILRKLTAQLKRDSELLLKAERRRQAQAPAVVPKADSARITAKGIRAMRRKLRLSQAQFGKLVGVTSVTVYNWEQKDGALKVRENARAALLSLRDIGAKEAKRNLEMVGKK